MLESTASFTPLLTPRLSAIETKVNGSGTAWIARVWPPPAAMALAVPEAPLTEAGGDAWPKKSQPQQTAFPVPAWIAQLWWPPAAMALAVPDVPLTPSLGDAWP